jgi:hypothetical protein
MVVGSPVHGSDLLPDYQNHSKGNTLVVGGPLGAFRGIANVSRIRFFSERASSDFRVFQR